MRIKEDELPFPSKNDLTGIIDKAGSASVRKLIAGEGVYLLCRDSEMAEWLSRFSFGQDVYASALRLTARAIHGFTITGVRVRGKKMENIETCMVSKLNEHFSGSIGKYSPSITKTYHNEVGNLVARVEYEILKPGAATYFYKHKGSFDLTLQEQNGIVEFRVLPKSGIDSTVAKGICEKIIEEVEAEEVTIDLERLPLESRIKLFAELMEDNRGQWRVANVCGLKVRHCDAKDDDDGRALSKKDVQTLTSAVLEGNKLHNHKVVKDLIAEDFYFFAGTFWCKEPGKSGFSGQVRIEIVFKRNPNLLTINVKDALIDTDEEQKHEVPSDEVVESISQYYWQEIYRRYEVEMDAVLGKAKKVRKTSK